MISFLFVIVVLLLGKWWYSFVGDNRREKFYNKIYKEYEVLNSTQLQQKKIWFSLDVENKSDFSLFFEVLLFGEAILFVPEFGKIFYQADIEKIFVSTEWLDIIITIPFVDRIVIVLLTALIVWLLKQEILLENGLRSKIIDRILAKKYGKYKYKIKRLTLRCS